MKNEERAEEREIGRKRRGSEGRKREDQPASKKDKSLKGLSTFQNFKYSRGKNLGLPIL